MAKKKLLEMKDQEKQARRNLIIDAAERVFAGKQFDKVSIRDIAREAGISHALIYHYFPGQQALFVEAFLRGVREIITCLRGIIDESGSDVEKATEGFISYLADHDRYFRMMTHFMLDGSLKEGHVDQLNSMERELFDQFDRLFDATEGRGRTRNISHAFFASMNGILITFRNYPGRNRDEVKRHMLDLGRIVAERFKPEG